MLEFLLLVAVTDVILILLVPEQVWLVIHRHVRKWVSQLVDKAKKMGD